MALHEILENNPRAPRAARQAVAAFLTRAHLTDLIDDAQLLTSELVTNAVRHAEGPIDVRAYVREGFLRLEVGDAAADRLPARRLAQPHDEGGRGMELVDLLSSSWGWRVCGNSKIVWLDIPLAASDPGSARSESPD